MPADELDASTIFEKSLEVRKARHPFEVSDRLEQSGIYGGEPDATKPPKITYRELMILVILSYGQFMIAACISIFAPFFPQVAEKKGATPTQYGFVFGVFEMVVVIMSPLYGKIVNFVSTKFLVTWGTFLTGATNILFGFIDRGPNGAPFIALAFATRIVQGIGASALLTASFTVIASEFPGKVAVTFSILETFFGFGLIAGPTIGGALYEAGSFVVPFAVIGALLMFGAVLSQILLPEIECPEKQETGNMRKFLFDIGIFMDSMAIITAMIFIGFNAATLEPHLRQFNLSPVSVGSVFIITGTIYAITTSFWGWLCDKGVDTGIICIVGYALSCIGLLLIGPVPFIPFDTELWTVILSLVILGLGIASKMVTSFISALRNTIKRGFPDDLATYGMVSALFASSNSIGCAIGPSLGGYLLEHIGYSMSTVVLLILDLVLMIGLSVYVFWRRAKSSNEDTLEEKEALLKNKEKKKDYV